MARIGIMTFLHNDNYGSILQAWALQNAVRSLGYDAEHIDYVPSQTEKMKNLLCSGNSPRLILDGMKKRSAARDEFGIGDSTLVVGHVGVTSPPLKNHPYLLRVFAEIKKEHPDAVLLMAGAEETDELKELAEGLGISESAHFLGRRSDISQLLSAMDVFIFPSFREGLPVSVVEAQAAGLPVLMSDTVTDEVCITDNIKRLSIDADPKVWAKEIETMPDDLRASAFEKVRDCGWDINKCAKTLVEFYER